MKIKTGDNIIMLAGKDKGKKGKVIAVLPEREKVMVEGLNLLTRHQRPRRQGEKGQKVQVPRAVCVSNVSLVCPKCGKSTRVGYRIESGKKQRMCKQCDSAIS